MSNNHKSRTTKDPKPVGRHSPANIGYGARELVNRRTVSFCRPFVWLTRLISLSFKGVPPSLRFGAPGHAFGEHHRGRPRRRRGELGFRPTRLWFGAATMFLGTIAHGESNQLSAVRTGYHKYGTPKVVKQEGSFHK